MNSLEPENLRNLTLSVLDQARKMQASAAEAMINVNTGLAINVRKNKVETIEHSKGKSLVVNLYFGKRLGSATTSALDPAAINHVLEKASYIARFTEEDPNVGLADQELLAYSYPDLDLYHPWDIKIDEAIALAKNCEAEALEYSKKISNSEGAAVDSSSNLRVYANTHNFSGTIASTIHSVSCSLIAEQKDEMQRDSYYTIARDAKDLESIDKLAIVAAQKTVNRLGARKISTRKCPIIFAAEVATSLFNHLIQALSGFNLYRNRSFLVNSLGKQIFSQEINLVEHPLIPKALGSAPFDFEGVKLKSNPLVTSGILQRYLLDSYAARKLQLQTTGNASGVHNLTITSNNPPLDFIELLRKMNNGLLVTELMGNGVNLVTGDYSRGIFGYWVEQGEIKYPVTGATIAGNLREIFLDIGAISSDFDRRGRVITGSILLNQMTVAGS